MIRDDNVQTIANWRLYTIFFFSGKLLPENLYI